jgi:hypothetical protein
MEGRGSEIEDLQVMWSAPWTGRERVCGDAIGAWADAAAAAAARGAVCDENLCALLDAGYEPGLAWEQARTSFQLVLDRLRCAPASLAVKLVVPLRSAHGAGAPPAEGAIATELDDAIPPSLVIHPPGDVPGWEHATVHRSPYGHHAFPGATATYVAHRAPDGSGYRRALVFERLQA